MKIFVRRVTVETVCSEIELPRLDGLPDRHIAGEVGRLVHVEIRALVESEADEAAWRSAVGKTLHVYEPDLVPEEDSSG